MAKRNSQRFGLDPKTCAQVREVLEPKIQNLEDLWQKLYLAMIDVATGAFTRQFLEEHLNMFVYPVLMLVVDIKDLHGINLEFGLTNGDVFLRSFKNELVRILRRERGAGRPSDKIFRWGGDEFVVVASISSKKDLRAVKAIERRLEKILPQRYIELERVNNRGLGRAHFGVHLVCGVADGPSSLGSLLDLLSKKRKKENTDKVRQILKLAKPA